MPMRLVPGARNAWRWFSVQAMALALTVQAAWLALPPDLLRAAPEWLAPAVSITLLVLGIVGRLVPQGDA